MGSFPDMNNDLERIIRGQGALDGLYSGIRRHRNLWQISSTAKGSALVWHIYLIINVRVFIKNSSAVEPPVSDHPKCKGLVVAYESQTARAKVLSQPRMKWYTYSKKYCKFTFP